MKYDTTLMQIEVMKSFEQFEVLFKGRKTIKKQSQYSFRYAESITMN